MYRERSTKPFCFHVEPGVSLALIQDHEAKDAPA
jgi:hypothetical protein